MTVLWFSHPERVRQHLSQAFSLEDQYDRLPRALPWARLCQPFGLKRFAPCHGCGLNAIISEPRSLLRAGSVVVFVFAALARSATTERGGQHDGEQQEEDSAHGDTRKRRESVGKGRK